MDSLLTKARLLTLYDVHAESVLVNSGYIEEIPPERARQRPKFKVLKPLPAKADYLELRKTQFTTTIQEAVDEAMGTAIGLKDELEEWHGNLPESLQYGSKADELECAIGELDSISELEVPQDLQQVKLEVLPMVSKTWTRRARLDAAIRVLEQVKAAINDPAFISDIEGVIQEMEAIEFPGMMG